MAPKKTDQKDPVQKAAAKEPTKASAAAPAKSKTPPICINCRFLSVGTWKGPTCVQPASPNYKKHMSDQGTCGKFSPKGARPTAPVEQKEPDQQPQQPQQQEEVPQDPSQQEGLYTPDAPTASELQGNEDSTQ